MANDRLQYIFDLVTGKNTVLPETEKVGKGAKKASKEVSGIGKSFSLLAKPIKSISDKIFSMGGLIAGVASAFAVSKVVDAAIEQEDAVNRLNAALKTTGEFSLEASEDLQEFASSIQLTTKFGDELILNQLALAKAFGASNEQAKIAVRAATELSVAAGINLEEATRRVGRAMSGSVDDVAKFAPAIKDLTKAQLEAGGAAEELIKALGGTASAQLNTFSGALQQTKNSFGDLLEVVGEYITKNPFILESVKAIGKAFVDIGKDISDNRKEFNKFVENTLTGFVGLLDGAGTLTTAMIKFGARIASIPDSITVTIAGAQVGLNNLLIKMQEVQLKINEFLDSFEPKSPAIRMLLGLTPVKGLDVAIIKANLETLKQENIELNKVAEMAAASVTNRLEETDKVAETAGEAIKGVAEKMKNAIKDIATVEVTATSDDKGVKSIGQKIGEELKAGLETPLTAFGVSLGQNLGEFIGGMGQGAEGAKKFLSGALTAVGDFIVPGLGQAIGPLFDMFSATPEQFKEKITEFINSIPQLILNVLQNAADFGLIITEAILGMLEKLSANLDKIVIRLFDSAVNNLPRIITAIIRSIPRIVINIIRAIPKIVQGFIDSLVKESPRLITEMIKGLGQGLEAMFKELISNIPILGGGGGGGGGILGGIPVIGGLFAQGGEVPSGFPNDSYPARLTSGEYVIDRSLTAELKSYLSGNNFTSLGNQILDELRRPQMATATIKLNEREFANIILELNRNNQRLTG